MTSALRQNGKERKMGKALIIGAGGVAGVVVHKCCQNSEVFTEICIASRTKSKCDALKKQVEEKGTKTKVTTAQAKFEYKYQWAYREKFEKAGITALLGSGFDPGVTGVFCAYAQKHYFDEINYIDILDCNGGDHGYPFATNFNPEIDIRKGQLYRGRQVGRNRAYGDKERVRL